MVRTRSKKSPSRRGAALIEFALVLPVLLLLIAGIIEFGRTVMVQQILTNASREGARKAALPGTTNSDVEAVVTNYMQAANVASADSVTVTPSASAAAAGDAVKVTVTIKFSKVGWLPMSWFVGDPLLNASTTMRKEFDDR
jgi:Flp pilus assembly protein TadG